MSMFVKRYGAAQAPVCKTVYEEECQTVQESLSKFYNVLSFFYIFHVFFRRDNAKLSKKRSAELSTGSKLKQLTDFTLDIEMSNVSKQLQNI